MPKKKAPSERAGARRAGRTRRSGRFPGTGAPAPGRWAPSRGGRPTRLARSRPTTGRRASSPPHRSRMGRAPRRSPGSGPCARRPAPTARAASSASRSPTTAPSPPTRAGSPRRPARRACSAATRADAALVMSRVDSEPRGGLARRSPAEMLAAALGEDARALMDAFGVELLEPAELDLTPGRVERARADGGEAPLAE